MTNAPATRAQPVSRQQLRDAGAHAEELGYCPIEQVVQQCVAVTDAPECLDESGYLKGLVTRHDLAGKGQSNPIEKGELTAVSAIVLHRTGGGSADGALSSFKSTAIGSHFVVDKDGTIIQAASLGKVTYHVGKIRSRCQESNTCDEDELKALKELREKHTGYGAYVAALHKHESAKVYPDRYPNNSDSLGIEVVSRYDDKTKTWEAPTAQQKAAIKELVDRLKVCFGLGQADIYEHDKISYKISGEGAGLYE